MAGFYSVGLRHPGADGKQASHSEAFTACKPVSKQGVCLVITVSWFHGEMLLTGLSQPAYHTRFNG